MKKQTTGTIKLNKVGKYSLFINRLYHSQHESLQDAISTANKQGCGSVELVDVPGKVIE